MYIHAKLYLNHLNKDFKPRNLIFSETPPYKHPTITAILFWPVLKLSESLGSLSTHVFETRTTTGRGHFACQDSSVSQIFIPSISNGEKILGNANAVVWRQVKRENSSLPVAVRVSKTRVLKLPIFLFKEPLYYGHPCNMATPLKQPLRYYGYLILAWTEAQSVIFLF